MSKVAAVQMASGPHVEPNLAEAARLIKVAVEQDAKLVVLPENFPIMGMDEQAKVVAREITGEGRIQTFLAEQALRHKVWIVGGTIPMECSDPNKVYSASLVFNSDGLQVARYDKIHLFDVHLVDSDEKYEESATIVPGSEIQVVDTPVGRLGLTVCYDLRFPELFRNLLNKDVQVISLPAAFTAQTGKAHWESLIRARAIENLVYVVAAAQGGYHVNGRETHGDSMIVDPWGRILKRLPSGAGVVVADLDLDRQANTRRTFPCINHRRLHCELP